MIKIQNITEGKIFKCRWYISTCILYKMDGKDEMLVKCKVPSLREESK